MPGTQPFDDHIKEEIRNRADIGAVIGRYVALKPAGQNLKGLCPFHKEKTPSFSVNPARGFFHCFGCGKGGDVFTFLTEMEGLSFPEALRKLADDTGVKLPERGGPAPDSPTNQNLPPKAELLRIHQAAAAFFYSQMRNSERAKGYLKSRGLRGETVKDFLVGYAPEGWSNLMDHCRKAGIPAKSLLACGLAVTKSEESTPYDRFRDRVIFPIFDSGGQVIAFAGRGMEKDAIPKYLNSPETPLYRKSRTLYGLHKTRSAIKDEKQVLIVEGYMDFLALYQAGIRNVVATCGTALTDEHAQVLRRFASRIVLVFDGDAAGQTAAQRGSVALLPHGLDVRVLLLPNDEDPDDFIRQRGAEAFNKLLAGALPAYQFLIDKAMAEGDPQSAPGKSAIVSSVLPVVRATQDPIIRQDLLRQLAERLSVREDLLYAQLKKGPGAGPERGAPGVREYLQSPEGRIVHLLYQQPDLAPAARQRIGPEAFTDPISAELYSTLVSAQEHGSPAEQAVAAIEDPDVKRVVALLAVAPPDPGGDCAEELQRSLWQIEWRFLRQRLADIRARMKAQPAAHDELVQEQVKVTSRLAELDRNR